MGAVSVDIGSFEEYRIEVLLFVVAHSGVKAHFRKRVAGLAPFVSPTRVAGAIFVATHAGGAGMCGTAVK